MALKDIKNQISAKKRTNKVTRAMEAVSAAKMRKTQGSAIAGRPYARAALSVLARLSGSADLARHPLARERAVKKTALVLITSDKGLAGALNSGVIKEAARFVKGRDVNDVIVYAYGRKGEEYFRRRGYAIPEAFENKRDDVPLSVMQELSRKLSAGFLAGEFDEVVAAYSNFRSTFEQVPTLRKLLPLSLEGISRLVSDITPAKGKWSDDAPVASPASYMVEPSPEEVLAVLVPRLVAVSLYHMLLEAKASEHSARMVAMKSASDKSDEMAELLTRKYNKVRQAAITREVSEIVGGREALAS
ncbi:MAG: ATP synthase F1 subunit gamma [Patescibacteria group bacterium]|nr:ATP synthase F1 subunit gamma [Patescibacteria group bacterium]MDE1965834.1 ATP synthase F1 subunit gamma [Patescibacteria group bacterium]